MCRSFEGFIQTVEKTTANEIEWVRCWMEDRPNMTSITFDLRP
jgi:hypothetical protein